MQAFRDGFHNSSNTSDGGTPAHPLLKNVLKSASHPSRVDIYGYERCRMTVQLTVYSPNVARQFPHFFTISCLHIPNEKADRKQNACPLHQPLLVSDDAPQCFRHLFRLITMPGITVWLDSEYPQCHSNQKIEQDGNPEVLIRGIALKICRRKATTASRHAARFIAWKCGPVTQEASL
jgi:hypothetical protein